MIDIIITLVFMMTLLMFSIFPAIKIVDYISKKKSIPQKAHNFLILFFTVAIALIGALFLKIA